MVLIDLPALSIKLCSSSEIIIIADLVIENWEISPGSGVVIPLRDTVNGDA
jgi:hypothetical protein